LPAGAGPTESRARGGHRRAARRRRRQKRLARGEAAAAAAEPPLGALLPPTALGVISEAFGDALATFVRDNPDGVLSARGKRVRRRSSAAAPSPRHLARPAVPRFQGSLLVVNRQTTFCPIQALVGPGAAHLLSS